MAASDETRVYWYYDEVTQKFVDELVEFPREHPKQEEPNDLAPPAAPPPAATPAPPAATPAATKSPTEGRKSGEKCEFCRGYGLQYVLRFDDVIDCPYCGGDGVV